MRKNIAERLLEERKRLGLNKSEIAQIGGIANSTYSNYEDGNRSLDGDFLAKISASGIDVQYVLTGIRSQQAVTTEPPANNATLTRKKLDKVVDDLNPEQQALLTKQAELIRRLNQCEVELSEFKKRVG